MDCQEKGTLGHANPYHSNLNLNYISAEHDRKEKDLNWCHEKIPK